MLNKKSRIFALILVLVLALSGCASLTQDNDAKPFPSETVESTETSTESTIDSIVEETTEEVTDSTEKTQEEQIETTEESQDQQEVQGEKPQEKEEPQETTKPETPTAEEKPSNEEPEKTNTTDVKTSTVTVTGSYHYEEAKKTLALVNAYRKENGLAELKWSDDLGPAAKTRAAEASICWSHTRPNGSQWYTVSKLVKGENLAKGYATAEEAFNAWLASDGHRENILWPEFKTMYVAFFEAENGWFWAQEFGY